jgi:hypothetical protein
LLGEKVLQGQKLPSVAWNPPIVRIQNNKLRSLQNATSTTEQDTAHTSPTTELNLYFDLGHVIIDVFCTYC